MKILYIELVNDDFDVKGVGFDVHSQNIVLFYYSFIILKNLRAKNEELKHFNIDSTYT